MKQQDNNVCKVSDFSGIITIPKVASIFSGRGSV